MADSTNITILNPDNFSTEGYQPSDENLLVSLSETNTFNVNTDYVEFFIFDLNNRVVSPLGSDGTFTGYSILDNEIYVNPEQDVNSRGIDTGIVNVLYNFFTKRLSSSPQATYYIKEISSNRTELRLDSNIISKTQIATSTAEFIAYREQDETFPDFYLNFGNNVLLIANNIQLDTDGTVLIKLYEPLPSNISLKSSLWVVEKISDGLAYEVRFNNVVNFVPQQTFIQGPNFNLPNKDELNNSTENQDLASFTSPSSQSEYQIRSYFDDPSININVDYSNFSNFVNFSSARSRIENFWYKVSLIESASIQITSQSALSSTTATSASLAPLNNLINNTITNFDKYEYYLYFESGSDTYPKTNTTPPYTLYSTESSTAITWYENKLTEADTYDEFNDNWIKNSIPEYISSDSDNAQYLTFTNMVGHFVDDNIWIYLKDTTNKWDADNRINAGVSKDLVAQVLRDMGVKLYQNNYSSGDLYSSFLGFTDSGSLFPFPYMTGSLPTPSGYEYISNFISASDEAVPLDDINKRIYKRIYHNLPYLLKSKGTVAGLRTLITSYGIPDTILRISEFGGKDRNNVNDWDLWKHQYNYAFQTNDDGYISSEWPLNSDWNAEFASVPNSIQFRFNAGLAIDAPASQSLWSLNNGGNVLAVLEYDTDLPITSGSYSGSIINPEYQYATLKFTVDNFTTSASVTLPFYNNDWWSVQINRTTPDTWELFTANKIYSGSDGSQIGFIASSSFSGANASVYDGASTSFFPSDGRNSIGSYRPFTGKYQEIRYFQQAISQSVFKDYVMNPQSTEGNGVNGSYSQLAFRATLGGELYTGSISVHPKVSGGYITQSFASDSNFNIINGEFSTNREWVFYDSPPVGIKNRNTDKIKQQELILPSGDTLSNLGSIQQKSYTTQDYTNNLNLLEVAFSPQNQINDDIISQIGYFNIGDYIGDPRLISSSANTYPSLVELSKQYFDKYSSNYDVYDYIRLIKFFDNSLFKMVKDFVPARTGIASGIVIKQHILERQKYPVPQAEWTQPEYTGSIGSIPGMLDGQRIYTSSTDYESFPIESITGSDGGTLPEVVHTIGYTLVQGTVLTSYITQNTTGCSFSPYIQVNAYNQNGKALLVRITQSGGVINYIDNRTLTSDPSNVGFNPGDVFTIYSSDVPGSTSNITFQLTDALVTGGRLINFQDYTNQSWDGINVTQVGDLAFTQEDAREFINGEFSGSTIITTDGELNTECDTFKEPNTQTITYNLSGSFDLDTYNFLNKLGGADYAFTSVGGVGLGKTLLFWKLERQESADRFGTPYWIWYYKIYGFGIKIPNSLNGIDVEDYIANATSFTFQNPNFLAVDFSVGSSWSSATGEGLQNNSTNLTLIPTGIQKRTAYPNLASGGQYYYISTEPSDLTFTFSTPKSAGYGDFDDITVAAKSALELLIEPYLPTEFENSDCNPLYGNATEVTPSTIYYDLDYSQGSITPVNFETVMNGTATKAPLQDYNYFARRSIIPRYSGSKNTSNSSYDTTSNIINQFSGSNQPIERRDSIITEFDWGGGTYPEIYDGGGVQLRQHLFVGNNREDVNLQVTTEDGFINTLKQTFPLNSTPVIQQYTTTSQNSVDARVAGYGFSVPSLSTFALPAPSSPNCTLNRSTSNIVFGEFTPEAYQVTTTSAGYETTGSAVSGSVIYTTISESIAEGDEWYITFYKEMPGVLQGELTPWTGETNFYSQRNSNGEYIDPLKSRGVWKIDRITYSFFNVFLYLEDSVQDLISSSTFVLGGTPPSNGKVGFLIWKAKVNDNLMVFVDATMSGVGKSGMTTNSPTTVLEQNFDYITRNFGSNTTTS